MLYDARTKSLHTDDGRFIKRVYCPREMKLSALQAVSGETNVKHCVACRESVHDLSTMSEAELIALVEKNPDICVFAQDVTSVVTLVDDWSHRSNKLTARLRRIDTVRSIDEMNRLSKGGVRLLIKPVEHSDQIKSKGQLWRSRATGELFVNSDYRYSIERANDDEPEKQWEVAVPWYFYRESFPAGPLAAYIIPDDLKPGEQVFIEDLIDDLVDDYNKAQEWASRRESGTATWNGEDFELDPTTLYPKLVLG